MTAVLDASAILAFVQGEAGSDVVEDQLVAGSRCGAANWSEVAQKVTRRRSGLGPGAGPPRELRPAGRGGGHRRCRVGRPPLATGRGPRPGRSPLPGHGPPPRRRCLDRRHRLGHRGAGSPDLRTPRTAAPSWSGPGARGSGARQAPIWCATRNGRSAGGAAQRPAAAVGPDGVLGPRAGTTMAARPRTVPRAMSRKSKASRHRVIWPSWTSKRPQTQN